MSALYPTLATHGFDGRVALERILAGSIYRTTAQAVASLSAFTHPDTVAQIPGGGALFPTVRMPARRRTLDELNGRRVGFDDNETAHHAFRWSNPGLSRWRDVQLNHVWPCASDPDSFTALGNLCAAPAFLAKLTDHAPSIAALLRRRAFELYGWRPLSEDEPERPEGFDEICWADPLPAVSRLEAVLRSHLLARPKSTAARAAREIGWAFSGWAPDHSL